MNTNLKPHPLSLLFPAMDADTFLNLKEDIKLRGQVEPIVTLDDMVLEGRHRLKACDELGIEPKTIPFPVNGHSPEQFVIAKNLLRRDLTQSQKAAIAVSLRQTIQAELHIRKSTKNCEGLHRKSAVDAGKLVGVAGSHIALCQSLKNRAPKLYKQVFDGTLTVSAAWRQFQSQGLVSTVKKKYAVPHSITSDAQAMEVITGLISSGWRVQIDRGLKENRVHFYGNFGVENFLSWKYVKPYTQFPDAVLSAAKAAVLKEHEDL